mmetsp:Transcript_15530/g.38283  ORF Transcript_15530/g.38283 Transcript_15530/m.38283 type:complete len:221 (+) Transcript_15530:1785-2447(+)
MTKAIFSTAFLTPNPARRLNSLHEAPNTFLVESGTQVFSDATSAPMPMEASSAVFEPVLDVQAFSTFVVIIGVFAALSFRTNQVEGAVQERKRALENLRVVKSKELAGDDSIDEAVIQLALNEFEVAVKKEENLRNIIPGVVRIVPPSSADSKEEEARVIAKQFLGKDFDIGTTKREEVQSRNVPTLALVAVLSLFILQAALFLTASDDLMAMSSVPSQM